MKQHRNSTTHTTRKHEQTIKNCVPWHQHNWSQGPSIKISVTHKFSLFLLDQSGLVNSQVQKVFSPVPWSPVGAWNYTHRACTTASFWPGTHWWPYTLMANDPSCGTIISQHNNWILFVNPIKTGEISRLCWAVLLAGRLQSFETCRNISYRLQSWFLTWTFETVNSCHVNNGRLLTFHALCQLLCLPIWCM